MSDDAPGGPGPPPDAAPPASGGPRPFEPLLRGVVAEGPGPVDVLRAYAWLAAPLLVFALGGLFVARVGRAQRRAAQDEAERAPGPTPAEARALAVEAQLREAEGLGPELEREGPAAAPVPPAAVERD